VQTYERILVTRLRLHLLSKADELIRYPGWSRFIIVLAANISLAAQAGTPNGPSAPDNSLMIYAVKVIHNRPFEEPFSGYGIYLGKGIVITAGHVVGRWPSFISSPRVLFGDKTLPAQIIKQGSPETIDLAILTVDQTNLPVSLRLRRNPLCKEPAQAGENVIVVVAQGIAYSHILTPHTLPPEYRSTFNTFIRDVWIPGGSGSGVFDAERKCLLGIITSKISDDNYRIENGHFVRDLATSTVDVKHFVPASTIRMFLPLGLRF
jgi:hypothetical protein